MTKKNLGKRNIKKSEQFNILNLWDYLYYRTTLFYKKTESKFGFEDNKMRGSYTAGFFFFMNILTLVSIILMIFFDKDTFKGNDYLAIASVVVFILSNLYSIQYFEQKRHNLIFENFKKENINQKKTRGNYLILYIILSIISFMTMAYIGNKFWI